jgi:phosphatidylglycerol:prolipoprotein diacylglycerol transferase
VTNPFAILFAVACLSGLLWLGFFEPGVCHMRAGERYEPRPLDRIDAGMASLFGGLLGSRVQFVLLHWGYYREQPLQIAWTWQGGFSWAGGAIGMLLALGIFALVNRLPFIRLADALALPAAWTSSLGWLGCQLQGCAYGAAANPGWLTPPMPDMMGVAAHRLPTQALGALWGLGLAGLLLAVRQRRMTCGLRGMLALSWLSAGQLGLSFLRGDPVTVVLGLRLDGLLAAGLLMTGLLLGALVSLRNG